TVDNFTLELTGKPRSPWNKKAGEVFARNFAQNDVSCKDMRTIREVFATHVLTLRKQYLKLSCDPDEEPSQRDLDIASANSSEQLTYPKRRERRYEASEGRTSLRHLTTIWKRIPYTACSGDESEHPESGLTRYVVTKLPWRSKELEEFFKHLDSVHMSTRWMARGKWDHGKLPNPRERGSDRVDRTSAPPPGLPVNCYDAEWLEDLKEADVDAYQDLDVQPPVDLTL
ncbi:uncharacterized protein B0H18DRAFT_838513, partial [Fomitopsis serialis]|uniref:uncharacterized protein n=1 Tax=Fomitopsis serialis TaxID=139415 RepID=UPI00200720A4